MSRPFSRWNQSELHEQISRRYFLQDSGLGLGALALATLWNRESRAAGSPSLLAAHPGQFPPRAKNIIFLFMAGGPSQLELFEDKPLLRKYNGETPPESFTQGRRFAFLKPDARLLGSAETFERYGQCGMTLSGLLPYHQQIVDDVCWLRGVATDVFNHGPAKFFMNSGAQNPGRPSLGAWVMYGLGSQSANLPGFVVLQSGPRGPRGGAALWSSGFLPTSLQGVPLRSQGPPILDLANPSGISSAAQGNFVRTVNELNALRFSTTEDAEISTRIQAYETAFRMQTSAPELMEISGETRETLDLYGAKPGEASFANNCLLARRLVERGVRFVQLYHTDWDHHGGKGYDLDVSLKDRCREVDQGAAALVLDLKRRGLLDETLVIWGGEFGRTPMGEARGTLGRDHHIDAFTMWMAGGGAASGYVHGATDDLGLGVTNGKVHVHDLHATILHLLGFHHEQLTFRYQGRDFRLTDVAGEVIPELIA